jgi:hypothetical protein
MGISQIIQTIIRSIGLSARGTARIDYREYDHMPHKSKSDRPWITRVKVPEDKIVQKGVHSF